MTAPDPVVGDRIVRQLINEGLIACGNIVPGVQSIYRWKGEIRNDSEILVILKTVRRQLHQVLARAEELHPYDVPELLVQEVVEGNRSYLEWVRKECR